jgi:hypothetical protein
MTTAAKIHEHYEKKGDRRSNGIGISTLGEECSRKLWYDFRWCAPLPKHSGQLKRLFDTGHREEARLIQDLRDIGYEVHDRDPETGEQFRVEHLGGHISGYLDGVGRGIVEDPSRFYVLETKTHNAKNFDKLQAKGVEKGHPKHFAQCQLGAHLAEEAGTLYLGQCKDDDNLYSELVQINGKKAQALLDKGEAIVFAATPPEKLKDNAEYPPCSWCDHRKLCHYSCGIRPVLPEMNCRTCLHSTPERDGTWTCEKKSLQLSKETQEQGCDEHLFIPDLLPFGRPIEADAEGRWVLYAGMVVNHAGGEVKKEDGR